MYAMMHIAIHDALNAIDRRFQPYILDLPETPGASVEAAVATAARDVLVPVLGQLLLNCLRPASLQPSTVWRRIMPRHSRTLTMGHPKHRASSSAVRRLP